MKDRVLSLLGTGPMTAAEIAYAMGITEAETLATLSHLVFVENVVTCKLDGGPKRRVYLLETPSKAFWEL